MEEGTPLLIRDWSCQWGTPNWCAPLHAQCRRRKETGMSKSSLKRLNKPTRFCINLLNEVDQDEHEDAIYTLKHSFAARETFSWLQYEMCVGDFAAEMAYRNALCAISCEVAHRAHGHRTAVSCGEWSRLAEALATPIEHDRYGKALIRTINGWWTV